MTERDRPNMFCATLPKLQKAWDATSYDALLRCPRYYQYSIIEGHRQDTTTFQWGSALHAGTEAFDRAVLRKASKEEATLAAIRGGLEKMGEWGIGWLCTACGHEIPMHETDGMPAGCSNCDATNPEYFKEQGKIWMPYPEDDNRRTRWTLVRILVMYADMFYKGAIQPYKFPDGTEAVELSFWLPLPLTSPDGDPYILCGHLDGLRKWKNDMWTGERKSTTSTLSPSYFKRYNPSVQISVYDLATWVLYPDLRHRGTILEAFQTGVNVSRIQRHPIVRTNEMREEFLKDMRYHLGEAERYAREDYWPKREASCNLYGGCPYQSICIKSPSMRKRFLSKFPVKKWDPTEER